MCGICGVVGFEDKALLKKMMESIRHRGPDDSGFYTGKKVCLGNRRLSIIDLKTGKQPIHNEDESVWIVFNGEIYNYKELKKELENKGHKFYTNSDTETIVHAYEEYGEQCPKKLRGMFAFAIWDTKKKKLFLARDKLGIKPLYYTVLQDSSIVFSSEMKSILQHPRVKREVDRQRLHDYLSFRYVPEPRTILKGIEKLAPGHCMVYKNGYFSLRKYWSLENVTDQRIKEKEYIKIFGDMLEKSVEERLISEVPLGMFLSGGVDSSTILALMSKMKEEPVKTFSIGYGLEDFKDELDSAKRVSDYFNTDHHEFIIDFNPMDLMPKVVWHMDEPIADPTALPVYLLSKMAKKYVTVVLVGEGADECIGGYEQYKIMMVAKRLRFIPKPLRLHTFQKIFKIFPDGTLDKLFRYTSSLGEEGKKRSIDFVSHYNGSHDDYSKINFIFTEEEKNNLYKNPELVLKNSSRILKPFFNVKTKSSLLNKMLTADKNTFLLHLLTKADKMTMAWGVEGRVPFLDHKLVELCSEMPDKMKVRGKTDKYVLRKAARRVVPDFVYKQKKTRFFVPVHHWFETTLKEDIEKIFSKREVEKRGYFRYEYIKKLLNNYEKSRLYYGRQLWNLLTFELWHRIFIDNERISINPEKVRVKQLS